MIISQRGGERGMKYNPDTIRKLIEEADKRNAEKAHITAAAIEKMLRSALLRTVPSAMRQKRN
jgi:hypothetical protein